jgi:hypothetical protein
MMSYPTKIDKLFGSIAQQSNRFDALLSKETLRTRLADDELYEWLKTESYPGEFPANLGTATR